MTHPRFVCFRYFIVPLDEHLFTQPATDQQKLDWFADAFLRTGEFTSESGIDHAVFKGKRSGDLGFGKLCRKRTIELHQKEEDELTEVLEEDWQPLDFLCALDATRQVLVIRYNSAIIQKIGTMAKVMARYANTQMFIHGYGVTFNPILSKETFWEFITEAKGKGVYRLTLNLESPNLFGASDSATKSLTSLRKVFNNSGASFTFINPKGGLKVPEKPIKTYQEYADRGGGSWELVVGRSSNKRRTVKSSDRAIKITIEADEPAEARELLERALDQFEEHL